MKPEIIKSVEEEPIPKLKREIEGVRREIANVKERVLKAASKLFQLPALEQQLAELLASSRWGSF